MLLKKAHWSQSYTAGATNFNIFICAIAKSATNLGFRFEQTSFNWFDRKEIMCCNEVFQCHKPRRTFPDYCDLHDL